MARLWTFSGINSYSPRTDRIVDYVWRTLDPHVSTRPQRRYASRLGTMAFYRDERNVLKLCPEAILDREAVDFTAGRGTRNAAIRGGMFRNRQVRCLVAAPKTTTPPPNASGLVVEIYWSPKDGIPNQSLFRSDSKNRWMKYHRGGGRIWTVQNNRGRGLAKGHDFRGFMVRSPHILKRTRRRRPGSGHRFHYGWRRIGKRAPTATDTIRAWLRDPAVDYVFVAHSQGANIAMHVLARGFA